jgi:chemotaxis protein MotB
MSRGGAYSEGSSRRQRRRAQRAAHSQHQDRWLVSYADLITLLFAFFTVMYAMSSVDGEKARRLAQSMANALKLTPPPAGAPSAAPGPELGAKNGESEDVAPTPRPAPPTPAEPPLGALADELRRLATLEPLAGRVRVGVDRRGVVVSLAEGSFFESGQTDVRQEAMPALDRLAASLRTHDQREALEITVEGHTDDRPVRGRHRSNWELSTERATAVVAWLIERHQFAPEHLSAAGYGQWRPVASNDSAEGRARNRRVDILVRLAGAPQ